MTLIQRIVSLDSYTSFPIPEVDVLFSQFRGSEVRRVPVIRIFGSTTTGQKACANVHGVFPYLYVEDDSESPNLDYDVALALDEQINSLLKEYGNKDVEHVYKIIRVTGRSFYGYKTTNQTFLKIFFSSTIALSKAVGLLQSGKILGRVFQPYETHIPFILQFLLDFNLYGMNLVHFKNVKFRGIPNHNVNEAPLQDHGAIDLNEIPSKHFLPARVQKRTRCEIEFDVTASDIVISSFSSGKNPGIEAIWLEEKERRRKEGILDWAEITILASQDRALESFVFKREQEFVSLLSSKLSSYNVDPDTLHVPHTPQTSIRSSLDSQIFTPSNQIEIDDIQIINSTSNVQNLESSVNANEMEWCEEDEEMVALLDELVREKENINRDDVNDKEALINAAVLADFENDPFLSPQENQNEDDNEKWESDMFSMSFSQHFYENEETSNKSSTSRNPNAKFDRSVIDQCDGQCDSSSDEEVVVIQEKLKPKLGVPFGRSKSFQAIGLRTPEKASGPVFSRTSSSNSISPSRSRIRPLTPPSPPIMDDSSSDEDCRVKDQKPSINTLLVYPLKILSPSSSPVRKRLKPVTPPSPPILSSDDDDSDVTIFNLSNDELDKEKEVKGSQNTSTSCEDKVETDYHAKLITNETPLDSRNSTPQIIREEGKQLHENDCNELGISSFYEYPGEGDFTQVEELDSEVDVRSEAHSIQSFYDYSEEMSGCLDESFEEACMTQFSLQHSDSDYSNCQSEEEPCNFRQQSKYSKLKMKQTRASLLEVKESLCPSSFKYEITPLKHPPSATEVGNWVARRLTREGSASFKETEGTSMDVEQERRNERVGEILRMKTILRKLRCEHGHQYPKTLSPFSNDLSLRKLGKQRGQIKSRRPSTVIEFSDSDSDCTDGHLKAFRFSGGGILSDGDDEISNCEDSDSESGVASPVVPTLVAFPACHPNSRPSTPLGVARQMKLKRRRLNWDLDDEGNRRVSLDESELDSISFTSQQSPGIGSQLNSSNFHDVKGLHEFQFLTTFSLEVHCDARDSLVPNPKEDPIQALFLYIHEDNESKNQNQEFKCFVVDSVGSSTWNASTFTDEMNLINGFIEFFRERNPDILVGFEIVRSSWGYLIDRGSHLGLDMKSELSRVIPFVRKNGTNQMSTKHEDPWDESITGRIVLNLWRLLRHELTVTSYSFENAVFQILHERVHRLSFRILADQWKIPKERNKVIAYYKRRVIDVIRMIDKLDLINRTSELARLFGIQFFEVLSRGSQFRVESIMLRLAKTQNLIAPSPSPSQRSTMMAPEYLPLIMEPESKFYTDPVAVLDFQSLYPSMMMAYNYCFSTCVGRVQHLGTNDSFDLGCLYQRISPEELKPLFDNNAIHISPCGVVFVKEFIQKGILGEMLEQILDTRQMVKRSMKKWKTNDTLQKVLDSRQLGLKLIANVTYGYTSANFSGRMPCVEVADSVVSKGRETLQRAIDYVKENEALYGARVVYGDTDSLFVHFPGKSRKDAFDLANRIVDEITSLNPKPVKLKLEKVYQPCILQTKKRYVGYAYETPDQIQPKYDAKGIETVRRDGCPATAKILKGALKILFVTHDEGQVKSFVQEQFRKIFMGRVSLSKYTFAREYRGRAGYRPNAVVPSLELAKLLAEKDPRAEPLPRQRVPYIVVYGNPNVPLIQLTRRPENFIENPNLRLNAHYYIEKAIIPPLQRCFGLAKMDVSKWYSEMPRKYLKSHYVEDGGRKGTIDQYFTSETCVKCESRTETGFCENCFSTIGQASEFLKEEQNRILGKFFGCSKICRDCSREDDMICINMDCPIKHRFLRYNRDFKTRIPKLQSLSTKLNQVMNF